MIPDYLEEFQIWELWKLSDDENEYELSSDLSDEKLESNVYLDESILSVWELCISANDQNSQELRSEVFTELKRCEENLSLRYMNLSSMPNIFPYGLKEIDLVSNQLTHIPDNLPETLEILNVEDNLVCIVPEKLPSNLRELQMSYNKITNIPETLPDSITHLIIYNNVITTLPNKLPKNLKRLVVCNNQLTNLPENLPESLEELEAGSNELTNLPNNLPKSLRILEVDNNKIKILSDTLPEMLDDFSVQNNKLSCLPVLAKLLRLEVLLISDNKLTSLPRNLPETLTSLYACNNNLSEIPNDLPSSLINLELDGNNISTVPENLPPQLERLSLNYNKFTEIPIKLPQSLNSLCLSNNLITEVLSNIENISNSTIYLEENPLTESSLEYLRHLLRTTNRPNVWFDGSHEYYENYVETRPLIEEIANWLNVESINPYWNIISEDLKTRPFSRLLYRLRQTQNFEIEQFKEDMSNWLCSLGEQTDSKQKLREKIFLVALEANESCNHRIGWSLNQMKILSIAQDVESGKYNDKIEELLKLARGMYRLNILDQISRQTVQSLKDACDEIEIYLEYQIRLREILDLPIDITKMNERYEFVIPDEDIELAINEIQDKEQIEFINYLLIDWQPWKEVLKRWNYDEFVKCENSIKNEEYFMQILDKRKMEYLLETDMSEVSLDIEIQLGAKVQRTIEKDIWLKLTNDFLRSLNLDSIEKL